MMKIFINLGEKMKITDTDNYRQIENILHAVLVVFDGFVAGGCFKNILLGEPVKDVDVFYETKEDFYKALNKVKEYKNTDDIRITHAYETKNVDVFKFKYKDKEVKIEMNKKIFGTPEYVLSKFDFTITKMAFYKHIAKTKNEFEEDLDTFEYNLMFHEDFFEHLFFKRLVVDGKILYPESTYERMIKYMRYGYMPCKETKVKIATEIHKLQRDLIFSDSFYAAEGID